MKPSADVVPFRDNTPQELGIVPALDHKFTETLRDDEGSKDEDSTGPTLPRAAHVLVQRKPEGRFTCHTSPSEKKTERTSTSITKTGAKGSPSSSATAGRCRADDWDPQMLFFLSKGYRVIATDRRGHGRSTQTGGGHDMDHYADDLKAVTDHLNLKDAIHVGHSTGGGQVVRYLARHGDKNVAKAAIISAVPPLMVKTPANPLGLPKSVFDDLQAQLAANRAKFYYDLPAGPFYGFNRPGVKTIEPLVWNWWRQGMMGGAKAGYDGIVAFSQTDFTEDLKKIPCRFWSCIARTTRSCPIRPPVHSQPSSSRTAR